MECSTASCRLFPRVSARSRRGSSLKSAIIAQKPSTLAEDLPSKKRTNWGKYDNSLEQAAAAWRNHKTVNWELEKPLDRTTSFATLASLLKRCGQAKALYHGRLVHAHIRRYRYDWNTFLGNWVVKMYGDCGSIEDARSVFDNLPKINLYSWNILMNAYAQNGCGREALECFQRMQCDGIRPDQVSFVAALDACSSIAALEKGQEVHAAIVRRGYDRQLIVGNALVNMYGKCASLGDARNVFNQMVNRDVISWTAMITALSQNGHCDEALDFFDQMQGAGFKPNPITFVCALDACASLADLKKGQEIHAAIVEAGYEGRADMGNGFLNMHNALVNMYGKCGSLEDARRVFSRMPSRTVASWTAMITACSQNGHSKEALCLFNRMQSDGIKPDQITFVTVLDACTSLAALEKGQEIHAAIVECGYEEQVVVGTALINLYGKCGSLEDARNVFGRMPVRDVVSWNAMIAACAHNGHGMEALDLFDYMQSDGFKPNHVTFLSVLAACSHTGRVDAARRYFNSMREDHSLIPKVEHNVCLIDILGRAGLLDDAENLINSMPLESKARVWLCLLGACRIYGDVERGARAASHAIKLDPENAAPYVLLSNIYAAAGRYDDAQQVRDIMNNSRLKKIDSCHMEVDRIVRESVLREVAQVDKMVYVFVPKEAAQVADID
ncbi:hypothetical protein O6H91_16G012500 [Diphasiastrum complanatum]|nr:hypothetical protein O6H91_16G012500 [Diphasiastrum complanatum]